jgi:hypothetical protein
MGLPLKSSDVVPDEESMSSDGGVLLLMVEAAADGSVHPRFLDQGFHRGVGMNELVSGVEWGRCDRGMWGPADRIGGLIFFFCRTARSRGLGWFDRPQGRSGALPFGRELC